MSVCVCVSLSLMCVSTNAGPSVRQGNPRGAGRRRQRTRQRPGLSAPPAGGRHWGGGGRRARGGAGRTNTPRGRPTGRPHRPQGYMPPQRPPPSHIPPSPPAQRAVGDWPGQGGAAWPRRGRRGVWGWRGPFPPRPAGWCGPFQEGRGAESAAPPASVTHAPGAGRRR